MDVKHRLKVDKEFREIVELLTNLIRAKNEVYMDSWQKYGEVASIFANIARKFDRLESILVLGKIPPNDDSKVDTVADLAAYSLMYLWWLKKNEPGLFKKWEDNSKRFIKEVEEKNHD